MISVEEAQGRILSAVTPLTSEVVSLTDGLGRVLAQDLTARTTQPPQDVSAMDGYAVRAEDLGRLPCQLTVVGEAPAGGSYAAPLGPGQAVRIFTGGPVPEGADTIIIQENTEADGDQVTVKVGAAPGSYIRKAGLDFSAGDRCLTKGRRLSARDIGLAAAMNQPWLRVVRRPSVAILSTGDELVLPGDPLGPNHLVGSNGFGLAAFVETCGGTALNLGIAKDQESSLTALTEGARRADLLVTSGGASVGKHDLVRSALGSVGLTLDFWKIAMRPGKPLMFGQLDGVPMLGLPGNPVSSMVCALLFLKPLIAALLGEEAQTNGLERARLSEALPANDRRQDYLRARLAQDASGQLVVTAFRQQDSSMFATLAQAGCLIVRPPFAEPAQAGEIVEILPLHHRRSI